MAGRRGGAARRMEGEKEKIEVVAMDAGAGDGLCGKPFSSKGSLDGRVRPRPRVPPILSHTEHH